jgi:hypothetical protein
VKIKENHGIFQKYCENEQYNISFEDSGCTAPVNIQIANGTAKSIIDWATKCKLDTWQRKAFEIITGQYILSHISNGQRQK